MAACCSSAARKPILISPNSVVGLPAEKKEGLSTTIIQQAGSILLEVEKRNVKHFEVETPYLAAVVKGTQFSVTVNAGSTKVGVLRGQVEVSDFKTGQIAQVMPGQAATVFEHGKPGLSLSGAGTFNPIEHGKPRASTIERVPVPKSGLSAPRNAASGHAIHALGPIDKGTKAAGAPKPSHQAAGGHVLPKAGVVRISSSLGEVKLNVHKVTQRARPRRGAPGQVRNANASTGRDGLERRQSECTPASNSSVQTAVTTSGVAAARQQRVGCEHDDSRDHGRCVQRRPRRRQRKFRRQTTRQGQPVTAIRQGNGNGNGTATTAPPATAGATTATAMAMAAATAAMATATPMATTSTEAIS